MDPARRLSSLGYEGQLHASLSITASTTEDCTPATSPTKFFQSSKSSYFEVLVMSGFRCDGC